MSDMLRLIGYKFSVYTWAARLALTAKGVAFKDEERNPFAEDVSEQHPFGRVPILRHGGFDLYETGAITAYVEGAFDGPSLMPGNAKATARVEQVVQIVDHYVYWPFVRQVFAQRVARPVEGHAPDEAEIAAGMAQVPKALWALEAIVVEGLALDGRLSRADCHLVPMIDYFLRTPYGYAAFARFDALGDWWAKMSAHPAVQATRPDF
jgi:glutathione S-transferase